MGKSGKSCRRKTNSKKSKFAGKKLKTKACSSKTRKLGRKQEKVKAPVHKTKDVQSAKISREIVKEATSSDTKITKKKEAIHSLAEKLKERKTLVEGKEKPGIPPRPKMRRGRKPKSLSEYTPVHNEENEFVNEYDYQGIEYDTGIQAMPRNEDHSFDMDRYEDHEEELNFDY